MKRRNNTTHDPEVANSDVSILRDIILKLKPTGEDGFEGLMAVVLTAITRTAFCLSKSGFQKGKDGQSTLDERSVCFEGKRYDGALPRDQVLTKLAEIAINDAGNTDLWILGSTGTVASQDRDSIHAMAERIGISTLVLDWNPLGLPSFPVLLAMASDTSASFLATKTGASEGQIRQEFAFVQSHLQYADRSDSIATTLDQSSFCPAHALAKNASYLGKAFSSSDRAQTIFGQALAPGDVSVPGIIDRSGLRQQLSVHAFSGPNEQAIAILGEDGNGKSWLFAQAWLSQQLKPFTIVILPSQINEHPTIENIESLLISTAIVQSEDINTEASRVRWHRHFERWKRQEVQDTPHFIVFIDGLNQRQSLPWSKILSSFAYVVKSLGGRLVFSCRSPYYKAVISNRIQCAVQIIDVPLWSHAELEQLLEAQGASRVKIPSNVSEFLRNPRILAIALKLTRSKGISVLEEISVSRLLFEYIRLGASPVTELLPEDQFLQGLQSHADDIVEGLKIHETIDLKIFRRRGPKKSELTMEEQLNLISEGRFFADVDGEATLYRIKEESLPLALGLSLLSLARQAERNGQNVRQQLARVLDPISALDRTADVLISAIMAACLQRDTPVVIAALATSFIALQNLDDDRFSEFQGLVAEVPSAFLVALEDSVLSEGIAAHLSWLTNALYECRTDPKCWASIVFHAKRWLSMYSIAPDKQIRSSQKPGSGKFLEEVSRIHALLDDRIVSRSRAEEDIFRDMVCEERGDYVHLHRAAFRFVAGRPLQEMSQEFRNWSLSTSFNGGVFDASEEYFNLLLFNRVDWEDTRHQLLEAARPLRTPETSVSGKWALVQILKSTGYSDDAKEAAELIRELRKDSETFSSWRLIEDWCSSDPCDPSSTKPENVCATALAYRQIDTGSLQVNHNAGMNDHFFEKAMPAMVRFEPAAAIQIVSSFAANVARRGFPDCKPAVFSLQSHTAALDSVTAELFVTQAISIAHRRPPDNKVDESSDRILASFSLMIAFPHLSGNEQISLLMKLPRSENILLSLCALFADADGDQFEAALEKAYADGDPVYQFRLLAFAIDTATHITVNSANIIANLVSSSDEMVRSCALGVQVRLDDEAFQRSFVENGWDGAGLTEGSYEAWYGSCILVRAASKGLISIGDCIDRLNSGAYGRLIDAVGADAAKLVAVRLEAALRHAASYPGDAPLPVIGKGMTEEAGPGLFTVEERDDSIDFFQMARESEKERTDRYKRNRQAAIEFQRKAAAEQAGLIVNGVGMGLIPALFEHVPDEVRRWLDLAVSLEDAALNRVRSVAVSTAAVLAVERPESAVQVLKRVERLDPYVRFTIGWSGVSAEAVTVWKATGPEPMRLLQHERLDKAQTDHDLANEVLAAVLADNVDAIRNYVFERRDRKEPVYIARALMVAGFSRNEPWALETIDAHKDDSGFLSEAYRAAKCAMDRFQWSEYWIEKMRSADNPVDLWRAGVLLTRIVDGRIDGPLPMIDPCGIPFQRYGRTFESDIKNRIRKWKSKRGNKLFGRRPPSAYLI